MFVSLFFFFWERLLQRQFITTYRNFKGFAVGQVWNCQAFVRSSSDFFRTNKLLRYIRENLLWVIGWMLPLPNSHKQTSSICCNCCGGGSEKSLWNNSEYWCIILFKPGLKLEIFKGTHFKVSAQGHGRPLYAKEYVDNEVAPRQSHRAWRQLPW